MLPITFLTLSFLLLIAALAGLRRARLNRLAQGAALLGLAPLGWVSLFYAFVVRAYLALGYWPTPSHPDPKDLAFTTHYMAILLGFPVVIAAVVISVVLLLCATRQSGLLQRGWFNGLGYLAGLGLWIGVLVADPGHYLVWLMD